MSTWYISPSGSDTTGDGSVGNPWKTFNKGITMAVSGDTVIAGAGTYTDVAAVNKHVNIIGVGSGSDPASNTIVATALASHVFTITAGGTSPANRLTIANLRIVGGRNGINITVPTGTTWANFLFSNVKQSAAVSPYNGVNLDGTTGHLGILNNITFTNCEFVDNTGGMGIRISQYVSIDGLYITNTDLSGNARAIYSQCIVTSAASRACYVRNVSVSYVDMSDCIEKGLYMEKLSNAVFDHITMNNSGQLADPNSLGFELNLKYKAYSNITITNSTFTNCGSPLGSTASFGLAIKARDDAPSYNTYPATLDGVTVTGCTFSGNKNAIGIGEPGKNGATPTNINMNNNRILTSTYYGVKADTQAITNATLNWWGTCVDAEVAVLAFENGTGQLLFRPYWCNSEMTQPSPGSFIQPTVSEYRVLTTGYDVLEDIINGEGIPVFADGKKRIITKPVPGGALPKVGGGYKRLNCGIVMDHNDALK